MSTFFLSLSAVDNQNLTSHDENITFQGCDNRICVWRCERGKKKRVLFVINFDRIFSQQFFRRFPTLFFIILCSHH